MDLKNTENIMNELEKNAKKIGEITASIEEFKKIISTLDQLPQNIEKKGSDYLEEIKDKHTTLSTELSKIQKDFEKLERDIPESIEKGVKKLTDTSKNFVDISKNISEFQSSNSTKMNEFEKKIERKIDAMKRKSEKDINDFKTHLDKANENISINSQNLKVSINWVLGLLVIIIVCLFVFYNLTIDI